MRKGTRIVSLCSVICLPPFSSSRRSLCASQEEWKEAQLSWALASFLSPSPSQSLQTCCKMKPFSPLPSQVPSLERQAFLCPSPPVTWGQSPGSNTQQCRSAPSGPLPSPETWWVHSCLKTFATGCSPDLAHFFPSVECSGPHFLHISAQTVPYQRSSLLIHRTVPIAPRPPCPLCFNLVQPLVILTHYACLLIGLLSGPGQEGGLSAPAGRAPWRQRDGLGLEPSPNPRDPARVWPAVGQGPVLVGR